MSDPHDNPCLACGACCMSYRVSFYWAEAHERGLPEHLTEKVNAHLSCMAGTWSKAPRCAALATASGGTVACSVYEARPSPCREVQPGDAQCQRARMRHGLPPLHLAAANPV